MIDNLTSYLLARLRCWLRGCPEGLRQSIKQLPRHLRRLAWVDFANEFPAALDAIGDYRVIVYRSRDGAMAFGGLHFIVPTTHVVFDYYLVRRRSDDRGDPAEAAQVRDLPWSDHRDEMELCPDMPL